MVLRKVEMTLDAAINNMVSGLIGVFDKDNNGTIDRSELQKAIPMLEDLTRVFKRVENVYQSADKGKAINNTDASAPIPQDRVLGVSGKHYK